MTKLDKDRGCGLHKRRRTADENGWPLRDRPGDLIKHLAIQAPAEASPTWGLRPRQRHEYREPVAGGGQPVELIPIDHVVYRAGRVKEPGRSGRARRGAVTRHRPSRP